jgi:predicted Zn-dependent protease
MDFQYVINMFKQLVPAVEFWSLRLVADGHETLNVRENIVQPPRLGQSRGAHITLINNGGIGYAATSQLTEAGLRHALEQALRWSECNARYALFNTTDIPRPTRSGVYQSQVREPWNDTSLNDKLSLLQEINHALKIDDCIVDWQAHLTRRDSETLLLTSDGIEIEQSFHYLLPGFAAVANRGTQTQSRSGGGWGSSFQGGLELLANYGFPEAAQQVAEEAIALLEAPECPDGRQSLLLMPSQMMLQIHESIGHPLELDRILGDERNYAGTSFVTPEMFGNYQYGSDLLNVTFDPELAHEAASYAFDDEGTHAERSFLIRDGVLERPLGGAVSQARAAMAGTANARACDWNRPAIDRMANLNLEPGDSSLAELIASTERGVLMETNKSWSIDDSRNKFQFGCELGRLIEDGELKGIVRNPNYRGISATFWRNLAGVGNGTTFQIWGTPYCGKGEPNQAIQVGHASPACLFHDVEVFGGA